MPRTTVPGGLRPGATHADVEAARQHRDQLIERHESATEAAETLATEIREANSGRLPTSGTDAERIRAAFTRADKAGEAVDAARRHLEQLLGVAYGGGQRRGRNVGDSIARQRETGWGTAAVAGAFGTGPTVHASLTPSGSVTVPALTETIVGDYDRPRSIIELVPWETLRGTDTWSYLRETAREHRAEEVAKQTKKPTSTYSVVRHDRTTSTVAHLSEPIARQDLDDAEMLRAYVETSLRAGVELALDTKLLFGEGPNIEGIAETAGITELDWAGDVLRTARLAVATFERRSIPLDRAAFLLSPEEWALLELLREHPDEAGDEGGYLLSRDSQPIDVAARRLWGVRVVPTPAVPDDDKHAWLVDFGSTTGRERETANVRWSETGYVEDLYGEDDHGDLFESNQVRAVGEGRFGFAVTRTQGVIQFDTEEPAG